MDYEKAFKKRLVYYASKLYRGQVLVTDKEDSSNLDYEEYLKNVTIISFSRLPFMLKNPDYYSTHKILDTKTFVCEMDAITFHLIDLSKFLRNVEELTTKVDVWSYFFKYIHKVDGATMNLFCEKNPFMKDVVNQWQGLRLSKEEFQAYFVRYCMAESSDLADSMKDLQQDIDVLIAKKIAKKMHAKGILGLFDL